MRNWVLPFREPIALKDGESIDTLKEAAEFMLSLPITAKSDPIWTQAAQLIMQASHSGTTEDFQRAQAHLRKALAAGGHLD